ncbi:GTPase-associated protein 1-related protein [Streptomyces sp. NPDC047000]|uniref:GTPase-associated protein 1-related protein n=1 Tax=Streptomyces sp. NPDC047000 TaxID=3155474 RepID=UPI0033DFCCBE
MSLVQLHYTSAPPGPDGSGFRFTAVSPGAPQQLLREAEQLIGYEPPRDGPARPDAEQLKDFPKAFSCSELADGGRLLSRSVCTGADYSGRWGNFHAHAVHLPPGTRLPDGALPITAWESPTWSDRTPADGRPVPAGRFAPSGLLRREGLIAFARSRAGRLAPFFADLRTLADGSDVRQLVIVERDSADVALWIALACTVLPREQAHRLTFTTYTRRPQQARQQLVGALPSSEPVAHDQRFRVHDCTGPAPAGPVTDTWADAAARVWCAGRPELFRDAPHELGPFAVAALTAGVALRSDGRTAAARRAVERAGTMDEETLARLVEALSTGTGTGKEPGDGSGAGRGAVSRARALAAEATAGVRATGDGTAAGEQEALAALLAELDGRVPASVSAPLAALVLASAVLARGPVPVLRAGSLTPRAQEELARELAPALWSGIADAAEPPAGRPLALLRVADLLDIDCTDVLPELAGRLARALVGRPDTDPGPDAPPAPGIRPAAPTRPAHPAGTPDPDPDSTAAPAAPASTGAPGTSVPGCPPAVLDAVHGHPALRIALFAALDALAAAHPVRVAARLGGSGLPVGLPPLRPHLRMCAAPPEPAAGGDRLARFQAVLRTAGVSPHAEPPVLRTAFHLVWPGPEDRPTGEEASLLLNEIGSDAHRAAGTRDLLIDAALAASADDPGVPFLAVDLLTRFSDELRPGQRAALLLLEFAGRLGTSAEGENWVRTVRQLRDGAAEPVPDPVTERAYAALARRLLATHVPESELYDLARAAEPGMLAAYERAARAERTADRLRASPAYLAARFCDWSAFPGTAPGWDEVRTALLGKVLRPVVRALPAADRAGVEEALGRTGGGKLDAYRAWNRPGAFGRLAGRLAGRGRRGGPDGRYDGAEPPAGEGRR